MSTFTGKNVHEAVQLGLKRLGLKRNQARVTVIQTGRRGFLGIGRRRAEVKVSRRISLRPRVKPQSEVVTSSLHNSASQPKITRYSRRSSASANRPKFSRQKQNQLVINKLKTYLNSVITLLGIQVTMKVIVKTPHRLKINLDTDKKGLLIGKHGLTINALQALAEIYLSRLGLYHVYVELDTANYRKRRMEILGHLAENTAREAVATGKPVYLDPMPSFERKKIHRTLEDSAHVTTYSAGREPYRAVVVAPK